EPAPRHAPDITPPPPRPSRPRPTRRKPPVTSGKWLTASVTDDIPTVITAMFDEAERRDPTHQRTWIALVDGNRTQIDAITDQASTRGVTVKVLIDFVHVLEYLCKGRLDGLLHRRPRRSALGRPPTPGPSSPAAPSTPQPPSPTKPTKAATTATNAPAPTPPSPTSPTRPPT